MLRKTILSIIDFFYIQPFPRWIPLQTFRYLFCGSFSNAVDICMYFISFHFILHEKILTIGIISISAPIAAFMMAFCISFPTGFMLSKFIVFTQSTIRSRIQLFRYLLLVASCVLLNYIFLKILVEQLHIYPTISKIITTVFVAFFSFLTQKHFTFRVTTVASSSILNKQEKII